VSGTGTALAATQPLVPGRCFAQVGVDHVVFGPRSFFLSKTVLGPTSFRENAGPTTVTYQGFVVNCPVVSLDVNPSR
jgi:hypothetical protein